MNELKAFTPRRMKMALLAVPLALGLLYFGLIASDRYVSETTVALQRAGNDGRIESGAVERLVARRVPVNVNGLRRPPLPDDRGDFVCFPGIDEDEGFPAEAVEILFEHAAGDE